MDPLWEKVTVPVTVIQGERDKLVPAGNADYAAKMLVNAPVEMVREPEMNHFVPWTRPDLIETAIQRHLDILENLTQIDAAASSRE